MLSASWSLELYSSFPSVAVESITLKLKYGLVCAVNFKIVLKGIRFKFAASHWHPPNLKKFCSIICFQIVELRIKLRPPHQQQKGESYHTTSQ